jgi:single-strand DNA-binding protein
MSTYTVTNALVATTPRHIVTADSIPLTAFRIVSTAIDTNRNENNNWMTVTIFGDLALWAAENVKKGSRLDVEGKLFVREWDNGERNGVSVEIEATKATKTKDRGCNCSHHNQ